MILYPAIDILAGRAVRLRRGDFEAPTVYRDDPVDAARDWVEGGARWLHVVDLDGARAGHPVNLGALERIARELGVPVQCGGGLRSLQDIDAALAAGAARAVVGTAAYRDPELLAAAVAAHGDALAVAVDVRAGRVSVAGWNGLWTVLATPLPDHTKFYAQVGAGLSDGTGGTAGDGRSSDAGPNGLSCGQVNNLHGYLTYDTAAYWTPTAYLADQFERGFNVVNGVDDNQQ